MPPSLTRRHAARARRERRADEALADLRQAEIARLEMLEEAVRPIIDQAPDDVELFDLGIAHGERPRLFLDMISFVDLAHDRRTYRFFQDTRHGRVLIAESESVDRIVAGGDQLCRAAAGRARAGARLRLAQQGSRAAAEGDAREGGGTDESGRRS